MTALTSIRLGRPPRWLGRLAAGCCCITMLALGADPMADPKADPKTDPKPPAKPALPTSFEFPTFTFVDDIKVGKDPFYPTSERRMPPKPKVTDTGTPIVQGETIQPLKAKTKASSYLTLKGMLGTRANRLVMISTPTDSYEFIGTKPQMVETPEGRVKIHCVEFKSEAVLISVEGETEPVLLKLSDK